MTISDIRATLCRDLRIGGNLVFSYLAMFKEAYDGDKRAIEDFRARYNDDGNGVVMTITINGKQKEFNFPLARCRYDYRKKRKEETK